MKRSIIIITRILLFTIGLLCALYVFMPWQEAGKFAMSFAHGQLSRRGMRLNYSDITGDDGGFTVHNLALGGMADVSLESVTIKPQITASILSLAPVCDITFKGGNIRLGQSMRFGDGGVLLTAGRDEILFENLRTNGEFSLNGYMTINPSAMRIGRADARLEVPEAMRGNMDMLRNFLPLVQEGGNWYLRRK